MLRIGSPRKRYSIAFACCCFVSPPFRGFDLTYGVKIFVITSFKDTCYIEILPNVKRSRRVIFLSFWAEVHYNSIYPEGGCSDKAQDCQLVSHNDVRDMFQHLRRRERKDGRFLETSTQYHLMNANEECGAAALFRYLHFISVVEFKGRCCHSANKMPAPLPC
ncbi:hypothetical protein RJ641_008472 [Dillenia turbinata]|uniref:OTU domain-containing protein n=1 Tax=Dillenia turbinata TaxID=194707 RepID=A0AAN8V1G1_9MAGN